MTNVQSLLQNEITAKVATALVESMTADRVLQLTREELNRSDGYYNKPFLQKLLGDIIKEAIRAEVVKQIEANNEILVNAVRKVVSTNLIQKMADKIEVQLSDSLKVIIKETKDDD